MAPSQIFTVLLALAAPIVGSGHEYQLPDIAGVSIPRNAGMGLMRMGRMANPPAMKANEARSANPMSGLLSKRFSFVCNNGNECPQGTKCCAGVCVSPEYSCCEGGESICSPGTNCCGSFCMPLASVCCIDDLGSCEEGAQCVYFDDDPDNVGCELTTTGYPHYPQLSTQTRRPATGTDDAAFPASWQSFSGQLVQTDALIYVSGTFTQTTFIATGTTPEAYFGTGSAAASSYFASIQAFEGLQAFPAGPTVDKAVQATLVRTAAAGAAKQTGGPKWAQGNENDSKAGKKSGGSSSKSKNAAAAAVTAAPLGMALVGAVAFML